MLRRLRYHLIDVFTDTPFGGNQLAVFTNGRGVPAELMQKIAREMNFSETTFVLPPADPANDYRVRIFTPGRELPMAGHPTVGTTFVLARERMIEAAARESTIRLEEGVGTIPVRVEWQGGQPAFAEMQQLPPTYGARFDDARLIAEMLSLEAGAIIDTNLPLEVISCGVPFLFVPLRDLDAVRRIRFRADVWERALGAFECREVFVFTRETVREGSSVHCRMFAPEMGVVEDPATGGASGPLGCYLVRHGVLGAAAGEARFVSEQGFELGRPSIIHIRIERRGDEIAAVRVGGQCRFVGEGFLEIEF